MKNLRYLLLFVIIAGVGISLYAGNKKTKKSKNNQIAVVKVATSDSISGDTTRSLGIYGVTGDCVQH